MCACGSDSVVECHLAKVKVAGPNPVSRSRGCEDNANYPREPAPEGARIMQIILESPLHKRIADLDYLQNTLKCNL